MLNLAVRNTKKLIRLKSKEENIRIGRLFTKKPAAALMAGLLDFSGLESARILDPGAGTGILSAAAVEEACRAGVKEITLCCYETDPELLPMLEDNLKRIRRRCRHDYGAKLLFEIHDENFVIAMRDYFVPTLETMFAPRYDAVIMNPPSESFDRKSPECKSAGNLCADETDIAFLFAVMGMTVLKEGGRMAAMLPTAYATAHYLTRIRQYLTESARIERMHLFLRSSKAAGKEDVLRRYMILGFVKESANEDSVIRISSSRNEGENAEILPPQPYGKIVREDGSLVLVKSAYDLDMIRCLEHMPETIASLGLSMHTGLVLDSRYPDLLRDAPEAGAIPLIHPACIEIGQIRFPLKEKGQYIVPRIPSLAQKNKNMLLVKRVPSRADRRQLLCAVYLASQLPRFRAVSTNNKLNYVDYDDGREMDSQFLHGLFALLSSDLYSDFAALTSAAGNVSASKFSSLPVPDEKTIRAIGAKVLMTRQLTPRVCTQLVYSTLHITA